MKLQFRCDRPTELFSRLLLYNFSHFTWMFSSCKKKNCSPKLIGLQVQTEIRVRNYSRFNSNNSPNINCSFQHTGYTQKCSDHGVQAVESGPKPTAPLVLLKGEKIPTVTDGPFGSSRRQRATRIRVLDSNRVRIQNCMTHVKQQRLWLKLNSILLRLYTNLHI